MNPTYLCNTHSLLLLTIIFFIFYVKNKSPFEYILAGLLVVSILLSQMFWSNPIQHSRIHRIDAVVAKLTIATFILYTLLYKFRYSYLLVLSALFITFYWSHSYSSQEWCSEQHIVWHGIFHVWCVIASFYAFL
jgi:hypothetical protein